MGTRPYIINQAFILSEGGKMMPAGSPLKILVDYSTYDGMVEDVSVEVFTNAVGMAMIESVSGDMYLDLDEKPESASSAFAFEDGNIIQCNEANTFREFHERFEVAYDYAKEMSPLISVDIYGSLARKTWYAIETRSIVS